MKQHRLTLTNLGMVPRNADASSEQPTVSVKPSAPPNVRLNGTEMTANLIPYIGF